MAMTKRTFKQLPKELQECKRCHWALPLSEFYKNKRYKSGYKTTCIKCNNHVRRIYYPHNAEKLATWQRNFRATEKDKCRNSQYKSLYGITIQDYYALCELQEGKCKICGKKPSKLVVDHNHNNGIVRDLLCNSCNKLLGFAKENTEILRNAINYINNHSSVEVNNNKTSMTG